jgi:hypothetical protein
MTIPGASRGRASRKDLRASVPPVDRAHDDHTLRCLDHGTRIGLFDDGVCGELRFHFYETVVLSGTPEACLGRRPFTVSQMMTFDSSRYCLTPIRVSL